MKKMKRQKLQLNIIQSKEIISKDESNQRLVKFFDLLLEWHLKEKIENEKALLDKQS